MLCIIGIQNLVNLKTILKIRRVYVQIFINVLRINMKSHTTYPQRHFSCVQWVFPLTSQICTAAASKSQHSMNQAIGQL